MALWISPLWTALLILFLSIPCDCAVLWSGAVTTNSAVIALEVTQQSTLAVALSSYANLISAPSYTRLLSTGTFKVPLTNLTADTRYYYGIQGDSTMQGTFKTFKDGPGSFTIAFASCANHGQNPPVFSEIAGKDILFFLHMGDLHYHDIAVNDPDLYRSAYRQVHSESNQMQLYRSAPIAYIFDDHDYGTNDADGLTPGRPAARAMYREYVPHYPLQIEGVDKPIYQAFTVGRVRFVLTDLRSESNNPSVPQYPNLNRGMMSNDQLIWFNSEMANAHKYSMIVWMSTKPFNGDTVSIGSATPSLWPNYPDTRRDVANMIALNNVTNLVALAGDAHMLAIDSGIYNDFSDSGGWGFPIFQAAPLFKPGSVKGGPYSEGCVGWRLLQSSSNYGMMTVTDDGINPICILWEGFQFDQGPNNKVMSYKACAPFNKRGYPANKSKPIDVCQIPLLPAAYWVLVIAIFIVVSLCCGLCGRCLLVRIRQSSSRPQKSSSAKKTNALAERGSPVAVSASPIEKFKS